MAPKSFHPILDQQNMLNLSNNSLEMLETLALLKKRGIGLLTDHHLHDDDRAWPLTLFSIDDLHSSRERRNYMTAEHTSYSPWRSMLKLADFMLNPISPGRQSRQDHKAMSSSGCPCHAVRLATDGSPASAG